MSGEQYKDLVFKKLKWFLKYINLKKCIGGIYMEKDPKGFNHRRNLGVG